MAAGNIVEAGLFSLYGAKQSGAGIDTAASPGVALASVDKRFAWISGDFSAERDDGQENWSTPSSRFRDGVDYVNTVQGQGEPVIAGHPLSVAQLCAWMLGTDSVSTVGSVNKHTLTPSVSSPYLTFAKSIGNNEKVIRRYANSRISQIQLECSKQSQLLKLTTTISSASPELYEAPNATLAGTAIPTVRPFVWADMIGGFTIDSGPGTSAVRSSELSFNVTMNDALNFAYGEGVSPLDVLPGDSEVTFNFTMVASHESILLLQELFYGTVSWNVSQAPTALTQLGSLNIDFVKKDPTNGNAYATSDTTNYGRLTIIIANAYFTPTAAIAPSPDGSPTEISFAGRARGATPLQIEVTAPIGATSLA